MTDLLHMRAKTLATITSDFFDQIVDGADAEAKPSPDVPILVRGLAVELIRKIKSGETLENLADIAAPFHRATRNLECAQTVLRRDFAVSLPDVVKNLEASLPAVLAAQKVLIAETSRQKELERTPV